MPKEINDTYDIVEAFKRIEDELIENMIANLDHHRDEETKEKLIWSQWQVEQLAALDEYKKRNLEKYTDIFKNINSKIDALISLQRAAGNANQEIALLNAMKKGAKLKKPGKTTKTMGEFFKANDRKINALIKATKADFTKCETAILRRANDQYRKIIFNAQMYAATGATYEKAVDMATKDFLRAGIDCVEYKNGARHTLSDYADMALRTAQKRAYLTGEGEKRAEWGVATVIVNKRNGACPLCLPFVGKILIDDVWSGGKAENAKYPLMSSAVAAGLYHPRCRDNHTTYFEGISTPPDSKFTKKELEDIEEQAKAEARKNYATSQANKLERMAKYSLDKDNKRAYKHRAEEWKEKADEEIVTNDDVLEEWIPRKTNSMKRNPADFRKTKQVEEITTAVDTIDIIDEFVDDTPKFEKATTTKQAIEFGKNLTKSGEFSVEGIHLNTVNGFNEAMYNVEQRFGRKLDIKGLKSVKTSDAKYHQGSYDPSTKMISLKGGMSANALSTYKTNAKKFFDSGWNASSDVYGTFYHEIGHAIWNDLPSEAKGELITLYKTTKHAAYEKWISQGGAYSGHSQAEVFGKELSRYALENEQEFFSEAFSQIMSGRMKMVSRKTNVILNKYYKVDNKVEDSLEKAAKSGKMYSGARILNPNSKEAKEFAEMYYPEIKSFTTDCERIAKNIGKSQEDIKKIKEYLFCTDDFEPDCAIAQSWQRLMQGKNIQKHDYTLIEHELYEMDIKNKNPNIEHYKAHELATKKYNYQKEVDEYYGNLNKPKKRE